MKAIKIYSKTIDTMKDGRKCTPYQIVIWYHGNVLFRKNRKTFVKPLINITDACLHIFGFRFTKGVVTK